MHTEILHYIVSGIIVSLSTTHGGGFVNKATETVNVNRTSEQKLLYFNFHTLRDYLTQKIEPDCDSSGGLGYISIAI